MKFIRTLNEEKSFVMLSCLTFIALSPGRSPRGLRLAPHRSQLSGYKSRPCGLCGLARAEIPLHRCLQGISSRETPLFTQFLLSFNDVLTTFKGKKRCEISSFHVFSHEFYHFEPRWAALGTGRRPWSSCSLEAFGHDIERLQDKAKSLKEEVRSRSKIRSKK